MSEIKNLQLYNARMAKGLEDKLFFTDKIDAKIFVDFGSADGTLLTFLSNKYPDAECIGYDINGKMVRIAKSKNEGKENIAFTTSWNNIENYLKKKRKKSALILSSVIHEVYAYSKPEQIKKFWNDVFNSGFDYIVIRDLMLSTSSYKKSNEEDVKKIKEKSNQKLLNDFENKQGLIERNKNMLHFLMKYKYENNWKREVLENYFPITVEELLSMIPSSYKITYKNTFVLPYAKDMIKKDFDIEIKDTTHIKLILEKKVKNFRNFLEEYLKEDMLLEYVQYIKGHRNSKGELSPWVIKSHETDEIISSHKTESAARTHLKDIQYFKHKG